MQKKQIKKKYINKKAQKNKTAKDSFVDFMRRSPIVGVELNLSRDQSLTREFKLK